MVTTARRLLDAFMPPAIMTAARAVKRKVKPVRAHWEIVPGGWEAVRAGGDIRGWNVKSAVEASVTRAKGFMTSSLSERLPFGMSPETVEAASLDVEFHNTAESFAHAFLSSTRLMQQASVLDWGGGLGQYSEICRAVAPDLQLDYYCRELPEFAQRGRTLFPKVTYFEDESWRSRKYDFVFASASLHYVEDWKAKFRELAEVAVGRRLFVTRLPVVFRAPAYVFVQRPYAWGFDTEYASWCLNRRDVLGLAEQMGLKKVWEFVTGERIAVTGAEEVGEYRGFLFDVPAQLR
jgi:putative methyltransferase (TIGR04325 family)